MSDRAQVNGSVSKNVRLILTVWRSPFTVHRSPFTVHRSPFTVHRSAVLNREIREWRRKGNTKFA
jgi:hypothetical protein